MNETLFLRYIRKKKKKEELLNTRLQWIEDSLKMLDERDDKLNRLIKYVSDKPTFHLEHITKLWDITDLITTKHFLYLYIDKDEYKVELESYPGYFGKDAIKYENLDVCDNIATFTTYIIDTKHTFIIEYKTGKVIHMKHKMDLVERVTE